MLLRNTWDLNIKARSWKCFNATRVPAGLIRTKQHFPRWALIGSSSATQRRRPWALKAAAAFNRHTSTVTFQFFIWMEWNIYINERPRNTCSRQKKKKSFCLFEFSCKEKENLDFFLTLFFKPLLYILWDMFWDPNTSQKWGLHTSPTSPKIKKK